jgi:hypothetical protein
MGGDPPLSGASGTGRLSFRGQNPAVESEARAASTRTSSSKKPAAVDDAGATVSDEELAARYGLSVWMLGLCHLGLDKGMEHIWCAQTGLFIPVGCWSDKSPTQGNDPKGAVGLLGSGPGPNEQDWVQMAAKSLLYCCAVFAAV